MLWKPCGLSGAVPKHSCPDVLWRLQAELAQARLGESHPWYVLSMDLEKCFYRLDIPNLRVLSSHLGLHACDHVLRMYSRLTHVLFVDNMPTDVWLQGSCLVGVPQGCPLACFFCNLISALWHLRISQTVPTALHYSYLDDRLILARSWDDLEAALIATKSLDASPRPVLNIGKCARGAVLPPRR